MGDRWTSFEVCIKHPSTQGQDDVYSLLEKLLDAGQKKIVETADWKISQSLLIETVGEDKEEEEDDFEDKSREELCALVRRGAGGRFGAARQAAPKKKAEREPPKGPPARDARDVRCGNCAGKGHTSQNCPEERRGPLSRTCFHCGEAGHLAIKCPKAPATGPRTRLVRSLDEVDNVPKVLDCRLLATDGYTPVHRLRRQ